jgi:DNA modification methylase
LISLDDMREDPRNARTHDEEQIELLAAAIHRWGWTQPVLIDASAENLIVAGHGRKSAALLLQERGDPIRLPDGKPLPPGKVPFIDVSGWSEEERRAYALADNQLALRADWDEDLLRGELEALSGFDFDIGLIGFDEKEIERLMGDLETAGDPEEVPETPAEPVSRPGDIWLMGEHRLACGSSTDPECVSALLAGDKPNLMVTDPPYGVGYDPSWRTEAGVNKWHQKVSTGKVDNDDQADWSEAWALFPGNVAYVWHGALHSGEVEQSLAASGFQMRAQIIWAKPSLVIGRGDYHWKHEPCWYAVRKGQRGGWTGDRKQSTLWEIANMHATQGDVDDGKTIHGTQKPVECMRRPMINNSKRGDLVYEPFCGSGTTIMAAELTVRRCLAVELNPAYVDVSVLRWEATTGREATLQGDGRTFAQVAEERRELVAA